MTTPLSITSRNQGQIFGAKPSMEEFERQLVQDPSFIAYERVRDAIVRFVNGFAVVRKATLSPMSAKRVQAPEVSA